SASLAFLRPGSARRPLRLRRAGVGLPGALEAGLRVGRASPVLVRERQAEHGALVVGVERERAPVGRHRLVVAARLAVEVPEQLVRLDDALVLRERLLREPDT